MNATEILASHRQAQQSRIQEADELLVVSDTTELTFPHHPAKEGLGDIGTAEMEIHGVKVHSTIGIDPQTHHMTGSLISSAHQQLRRWRRRSSLLYHLLEVFDLPSQFIDH